MNAFDQRWVGEVNGVPLVDDAQRRLTFAHRRDVTVSGEALVDEANAERSQEMLEVGDRRDVVVFAPDD